MEAKTNNELTTAFLALVERTVATAILTKVTWIKTKIANLVPLGLEPRTSRV